MPGLATMKPVLKARGSGVSKAMSRAKEERGLGALLSQVRVSPAKKGRRPTDLQALGVLDRSNLAMRLRMKLLGEGGDEEASGEEPVSIVREPQPEPSSVCLAAMVDEFLEDETSDRKNGRSRLNFDDGSSTGDEDSKSSLRDDLFAVLHSSVDSLPERILSGEVSKAVAAVNAGKYVGDGLPNFLVRHVVRHLRGVGHNAGICKSRWDHSGGFPGGEYEYIDVVFEGPSGRWERIVVDLDFKAQFEIARPTAQYDALVQALPSVFVGRQDQLQWIVNVMSEAVKLSLKKRGMHLPPWRKPEYMRAKWFSSYKRTATDIWTNTIDEITEVTSDVSDVSLVVNASVRSLDMFTDPQKPEAKPVLKELNDENRVASGERLLDAGGLVPGSIDNNDWHLPILKAKKSQGRGHAGLASLFKEASLNSSMRKDLKGKGA
ncbi:hypothetical protein M758_8G171100 [Ceratodon purpureus]|nr:hypothetical protein M758_8G171100 [Ceratodon purpureus]